MKTQFNNFSRLLLFLLFITLISCRKEIVTYPEENVLDVMTKVNSWLDDQKKVPSQSNSGNVQSNSIEIKHISPTSTSNANIAMLNSNIDILKDNLEFNKRLQSEINKKYNYIIIPIKDDVKSKKKVESSASLSLVLETDKTGKIISGTIASYLPKDKKARGYNGVQTVADIFKGKGPTDSALVQFMDVTGRFLHEMGFKNGKVSSYGAIKSKSNKQQISTNSTGCTDWYLVITYYDEFGNVVGETSRYIGRTCTATTVICPSGDYGVICPGDSGGGDGGGGTSGVTVNWEDDISSSSSESGSFVDNTPSGPSGAGIEPPIEIKYFARKKMESYNGFDRCTDVVISPASIMNPSVTFIASNGVTLYRDARITAQSTNWHYLTITSVWIEWNGTLFFDYAWYGGVDFHTKPLHHVRIG